MRTNKPISVTLGPQQASLDAMVQSGRFSSASEALRAAVKALELQEAAFDEYLREKVLKSLADPRPSVPLEDVAERLRARNAKAVKAGKRGA